MNITFDFKAKHSLFLGLNMSNDSKLNKLQTEVKNYQIEQRYINFQVFSLISPNSGRTTVYITSHFIFHNIDGTQDIPINGIIRTLLEI